MVLGAGLGSRLRPFTDHFPKPLLPVLGVPCIEFPLLCLKAAQIKDAVVNIHAHAEQMRAYLRSNPVLDLRLKESDEEHELLGSAGGFRKALNEFSGNAFFSMNADVIHLAPLLDLELAHLRLKEKHGVAMTLILSKGKVLSEQTGEYTEILTDSLTGLITGFGKKKKQVPFYTGTAIFESEAFLHLKEGAKAEFVPEVLEPLIKAGKVGYLESDALWVDIGSPELWMKAIHRMERAIEAEELPEFILKRLEQADRSVGGRFELGKNRIKYDDIVYET